MSIRVLVVDDSSFMRRMLSRAVEGAEGIELVGLARDGVEAVEKVAELDPDVVTLDIEMPRKTGLEALAEFRPRHARRPAVVMCSSLTVEGSDAALEALRLGASDFIAKDTSFSVADGETFSRELLAKIRAVAPRAIAARGRAGGGGRGSIVRVPAPGRAPSGATERASGPGLGSASGARPAGRAEVPSGMKVIVVGSSTGGPPVLEAFVKSLPAGFGVPVVIAQHMPELFTRSLATRLDDLCELDVRLAASGQPLTAGTVTIGVGGRHVGVSKRGPHRIEVLDEPVDALYKPDVDVLFESASAAFGAAVVGVVFTGMGDDGADGAGVIRAAGGTVLAQDEESSVVYGMPRAVTERGHASVVGSPAELFAFLRAAGGRSEPGSGGGLRRSA